LYNSVAPAEQHEGKWDDERAASLSMATTNSRVERLPMQEGTLASGIKQGGGHVTFFKWWCAVGVGIQLLSGAAKVVA
jgi:hypothetical protein